MKDYNSKFNGTFAFYLIYIGIRSIEFTYTPEELSLNTRYFRKCYNQRMSPDKALLLLSSYLSGDFKI